ncbi:MAG: hypothetical protein KY476_00655 [Planctomycetes bacterium]|nr:hypothetical protein [Planctomycetota bacterium]
MQYRKRDRSRQRAPWRWPVGGLATPEAEPLPAGAQVLPERRPYRSRTVHVAPFATPIETPEPPVVAEESVQLFPSRRPFRSRTAHVAPFATPIETPEPPPPEGLQVYPSRRPHRSRTAHVAPFSVPLETPAADPTEGRPVYRDRRPHRSRTAHVAPFSVPPPVPRIGRLLPDSAAPFASTRIPPLPDSA